MFVCVVLSSRNLHFISGHSFHALSRVIYLPLLPIAPARSVGGKSFIEFTRSGKHLIKSVQWAMDLVLSPLMAHSVLSESGTVPNLCEHKD